MNRIDKKFGELKKSGKKAFIAFITAGYPDLKTTEKLVLEFDRRGVDIVELGVPFSDPLADGPVIQEASYQALKKKVNLHKILELVKTLRLVTQMPICLMTYYNPIFCFGEEKFIKAAKISGVDGIIIPDLTPEEGKGFLKTAGISGIDTILFISPTTTLERAKYIAGLSKGFIYYVSLTGVTGARTKLPVDLVKNLKSLKRLTKKPVCVGFGVSDSAQVREINRHASGVIVGSAIVRRIKDNLNKKDLTTRVGNFVSSLKNV